MSEEAKPVESSKAPLLSLDSLDLGPAWARGETERKGGGESDGKRRQRKSGGRGTDNRGDGRGKGSQDRGQRSGRRSDRREESGRRNGRGEGRQKFQRDRKGRRDDNRQSPRAREQIEPPEGFTAGVMPVEEGLDGLAKEIMAGGRTYSVFDLSKLVLGSRERFNVTFQSGKESGGLIRCKKDGSLWLTREEAIRHFWQAEWRRDFYEEVVSDAEPPKGNFQAIGRCGISGELLGPPNYHGYQTAIVQLHRERFGNMSLDAFRKKIKMEHGEEVVAAWMEKMAKRIAYRPTGGIKGDDEKHSGGREPEEEHVSKSEDPRSTESTTSLEEESSSDGLPVPSEKDFSEKADTADTADTAENVAAEEAVPSLELPPEARVPCLEDPRVVERHFVEHHFDQAFQETGRAWVGGNIRGNLLSPGLLALLRQTVAEERRYPGKLTPILCRQLSGRHVAVFKWKRKLKAGPSRPHSVPGDIAIADRPLALLNWVKKHSGHKLELLWKDVLPEGINDSEKAEWYHDLHWLLNQGYLLLMADSTIHLAKKETKGGAAGLKNSDSAEKSGKSGKSENQSSSSETDATESLEDTSRIVIKRSGDLAGSREEGEGKPGRAQQVEDNADPGDLPSGSVPPAEAELQAPDEPELPT